MAKAERSQSKSTVLLQAHHSLKRLVASQQRKLDLAAQFVDACANNEDRRSLAALGLPDVEEPLLHLAVYANSLQLVTLLLDQYGVPVDQVGKLRCWNRLGIRASVTPLWVAASLNHVDIMKMLLAKGASVSYTDDQRRTPLHAAAICGQSAALELLLTSGADVNATDCGGKTPLIIAYRDTRICQLLLDHEADVNKPDNELTTALQLAYESGCLELVEFFVKRGADAYVKNARGEDLLVLAAARFGFVFGHRKISLDVIVDLVKPPPARLAEALTLTGAKLVAFCCQVVLPQGELVHSHDEVLTLWWRAHKLREGVLTVRDTPILTLAPTDTELEPLRAQFRTCTALKVEAVRIHEEILGEGHCCTFTVLRHLTYWYKGQGNMKKAIEMSLHLLQRWNCAESVNPTEGNPVFFYLLHCLCLAYCSPRAREEGSDDNLAFIGKALDHIVDEFVCLAKYARKCGLVEYEKMAVHSKESSLLHVVGIALNLASDDSDHRLSKLRISLSRIAKLERASFARAPFRLLHASLGPTTPSVYYSDPEAHVIHDLPRPGVVRFLLSCGFDVDGRNEQRETALNICGQLHTNVAVAEDRKRRLREAAEELLSHRAHWDARDAKGRMAYEDLPFLHVGRHLRLQCLAARAVRSLRTTTSRVGKIDNDWLEAFIDMH